MPANKILLNPAHEVEAAALAVRTQGSGDGVWAWVGLAFLFVGGADLILTWLPLELGNREWEFGSVTTSMNGLPVPVLGLAALVYAGVKGRSWAAAVGMAVAVTLLLFLLYGLVLWATGIPLALETVPAEYAQGLEKALWKTSVQGIVYPPLLAALAYRAGKALRAEGP